MASRSIGSVEATLHANTRAFVTEAKAATDQVEGEDVTVPLDPDLDEEALRVQLAKARRIIEQNPPVLRVDADADTLEAEAAIELLREQVESADLAISIGGEVDNDDLRAAIELARETVERARDVEMEVDLELARGTVGALKLEANARLEPGVDMEVELELDDSSAAMARLESRAKSHGVRGGRSFGQGFVSQLGDDSMWIGLGLSVAAPLAQGIEAGIGGAAAIIGSGMSAVGGLVGGAAPLIAAGAAAMGALAIGVGDVNEAIGAIDEGDWDTLDSALSNMTPHAQQFVAAFAAITPELDEIRDNVQQALFAGLDTELINLKDETLPDVGDAFVIAADSVNEFLGSLIKVAEDTDFKGTMEAIDPALDNAFDSASSLAGVLEPLLKDAAPAAEELTGWIAASAASFAYWVDQNPDKIATFFSDGVEDLEKWASLLGTAAGLMFTIFSSGSDTGSSMVERLDHLLETWDTFLKSTEGQTALDDFFAGADETLGNMEPLFRGLMDAWDVLTDPSNAGQWENLMKQLGEAAPALAEMLTAISGLQIGAGLANVVDVLGVFAEIFQLLPDDVQQFAGQILVVTKLLGPLTTALKLAGSSTGWMVALNVAIGAGVFLWDKFIDGEDEVAQNTEELGESLSFAFDQLTSMGEAGDTASLGMKALNDAIADQDWADDLADDLGTLNMTMDDAGDAMVRLAGTDGQQMYEFFRDTLKQSDLFGEGLELNAEQAQMLAGALTTGESDWGDLGDTIERVSEQTGISEDELRNATDALKGLDEQADSADFEELIRGQLDAASSASDMKKAALEAAEAATGIDWETASIDELVTLYDEYGRQLVTAKDNADQLAIAEQNRGHFISDIVGKTESLIAIEKQRQDAIAAQRAEAMQAYRDEQQAAADLLDAVREVATSQLGLDGGFVDAIMGLGEAFDQATEAANDFNNVMEVFRGGKPDFLSATADMEEALDGLAEVIKGTNEAGEEFDIAPAIAATKDAFDLGEDAGRQYQERVIAMADDILAFGAAGLQAGEDTGMLVDRMEDMRTSLEDQLVLWGFSQEGAEAYVNTLLGTPETLETAINTPGLLDALMNAEDLSVLYDEAGNPVVTEFEALGLDLTTEQMEALREIILEMDGEEFGPEIEVGGHREFSDDVSEAQSQVTDLDESTADPNLTLSTQVVMLALLAAVKTMLNDINDDIVEPDLKIGGYTKAVTDLTVIDTKLDALDAYLANPTVQITNYSTAIDQLGRIQDKVRQIDTMSASVSITLPGIWDRINEVQRLDAEIRGLQNRTVTITTNRQVKTIGGAMAGELITGPTVRNVGERGYREAIVPLDLPLSRVDASVRDMAALLRGQSGGAVTSSTDDSKPRVQVNQVIHTELADPAEVAIQVVNRIATLME